MYTVLNFKDQLLKRIIQTTIKTKRYDIPLKEHVNKLAYHALVISVQNRVVKVVITEADTQLMLCTQFQCFVHAQYYRGMLCHVTNTVDT